MILELVVAAMLLGTAFVVTVPMLASISRQQRDAAQRQIAAQEVANLMERMTSAKWDDLAADKTGAWTLSKDTERQLPDAKLSIQIVPESQPTAAKRIAVTLEWKGHSGMATAPVRLVAWVYRARRAE